MFPSWRCATTTAPSVSTSKSRSASLEIRGGGQFSFMGSAAGRFFLILGPRDKFGKVRFQIFHGLLRSLLSERETRSLRLLGNFRKNLQHALAQGRAVIREKALEVFRSEIFIVDRDLGFAERFRVEVLLKASYESVHELFGAGIVGLRIQHAGAKLLHAGAHELLTKTLRAGEIYKLADIGFFSGINAARRL